MDAGRLAAQDSFRRRGFVEQVAIEIVLWIQLPEPVEIPDRSAGIGPPLSRIHPSHPHLVVELPSIDVNLLRQPEEPGGPLRPILPADPLQAPCRDDHHLGGQGVVVAPIGGIGGVDQGLDLETVEVQIRRRFMTSLPIAWTRRAAREQKGCRRKGGQGG